MIDEPLAGFSGSYVDDILLCSANAFTRHRLSTNKKFEMADDEGFPCTFTGFRLSYDSDQAVQLDQHRYDERITPLPEDGTFKDLASLRMQLAWLSHSSPDLLFEVSQLTQVTDDVFRESPISVTKQANRAVRIAHQDQVTIKFPKLDLDTLRIIGISDASFANNKDLPSQLGFIV